MRDVLSLDPRVLVFSGVLAVFLLIVALAPLFGGAVATTISSPVQSTAADTHKLGAGECRLDQYAYTPTCSMQGRTIRVINF